MLNLSNNDNLQATISVFRLVKSISINCQDLLTTENTNSDLKVHALHYANELLVRVRLSFQKLRKFAQHGKTIRNKCLRAQTTINHISIPTFLCFLPQYQRQRKCVFFFFRARAEKALRDTLTRAAWYGL